MGYCQLRLFCAQVRQVKWICTLSFVLVVEDIVSLEMVVPKIDVG